MGPLDGLVALVTGAGTGIGLEAAVRLARDGAAVACNGQERADLDEVLDRIAAVGGQAVAVLGDVSAPDDIRRIVAETDELLGGLHVVVNNAGLQEGRPFLELELEDWRRQLAVDLDGAFLIALHGCRLMAARGGGVVINVTSVHEQQPRPGFAAYCTAKAGLGMLTKVMARELAQHGIRVVAVAPGAVETPIQGEQTKQERREQEAGIPAGRLGQPEEVAGLIAWLASPAAAYVSGTTVVIDGALMTQVSLA